MKRNSSIIGSAALGVTIGVLMIASWIVVLLVWATFIAPYLPFLVCLSTNGSSCDVGMPGNGWIRFLMGFVPAAIGLFICLYGVDRTDKFILNRTWVFPTVTTWLCGILVLAFSAIVASLQTFVIFLISDGGFSFFYLNALATIVVPIFLAISFIRYDAAKHRRKYLDSI